MVKSTVRSGSKPNARSKHVESPTGPNNAVERHTSSPEPFSMQTAAALAAATPEPTAAPAMTFGWQPTDSLACNSPLSETQFSADTIKQSSLPTTAKPSSAFVEVTAVSTPAPAQVWIQQSPAGRKRQLLLHRLPLQHLEAVCPSVPLHLCIVHLPVDWAGTTGHKVAAECCPVQEGSSSEAPVPTFPPALAAFTAPECNLPSTSTLPGDAAGTTGHKVTEGLSKNDIEHSSPSPAGAESFSFASPQPSSAAFGGSFSAASSAGFGRGPLPGGMHGDKPTSKETLPGRRRVSLNKARIPAVRLESSAGVGTASALAQEGPAPTAAEPAAFSAGTGAAAQQAGFGTSIAWKAPFSRPGASAQPSGFSFHGNGSSKEEDVGAMAREAIKIAREAKAEVQTLQKRLDAAEATISGQQKRIDALIAQTGLKDAHAIQTLLKSCKRRILTGGPAASLEAFDGIAGVLGKALGALTADIVRVKFFVASEESLSRLQTSMGATEVLKEADVMMKGGLAAVLDQNLMHICQLVDLRCQRVLEEADWRLRLARAIGSDAANAPGIEQNAKIYPVNKATVEDITGDDKPGHNSDAPTEDVTAEDAVAHCAAAAGIDAADSTSAAVNNATHPVDVAANTVYAGAPAVSSQKAFTGLTADSSAGETVFNIPSSCAILKQNNIDSNSAEETAAALDPTAPSRDMVGATQSADALVEAQLHKAAAVAEGTATRADQNGPVQQHLATATLPAEQGLSAVVLNQNLSLPVVRLALTVDVLSESPAVQVALTADQGSPAELAGHTSSGPIPSEAVAAEPAHTASDLAAVHLIAALEQVPRSKPLALPATEQEKFTDITASPAADTAGDAAEQAIGLASLPLDLEDCLEGWPDVAGSGSKSGSESGVAEHTDFNAGDVLEDAAAESSGEAEADAVRFALGWKSTLLLTLGGGLVVCAAAKWAGVSGSVYDAQCVPT